MFLQKSNPIAVSNRFEGLNDDDLNIVPGTSSYSDVSKPQPSKKKVIVFSDSMTKRIKPYEFNNLTPNSQTKFRSFPGANCKHLKSYIGSTLDDENFDVTLIHCGTNDLEPRNNRPNLTDDDIVNEIKEMGQKCSHHGSNELYPA